MLALCLLLTALPTAVLAEGLDGITEVSGKVVYNSQSTYYYDGNPVTFNPSCEGITEWDVSYSDSTGGALGYAPSEIGSYSVQMTGKGADCYANVTHSFSIVKGKIAYSAGDYSGTYDGEAHSISLSVTTPGVAAYYLGPDDSEYAEVNPTFTAPGTYAVSYMLEKENYETVTGSATVTISKATIEYSIGGFDGTDEYSIEYDGQPHAISVNVSTSGVSVRYATAYEGPYSEDMPTFTDAGNHVVYFRLEKQNYETEEGSVTVEITPADVSSQVSFNKKEFYTYTGEPVDFAPSFDGIKEWSYAYYDANNVPLDEAPTAVGSYRVEITGEGANCYAEIEHSYSILAADIAYTADGYTGVYDGKPHSITVDVTTESATVTYTASLDEPYTETNPTFTDAGEHPVWFKIEKDNYANVGGCKTVTITKADVSSQVSFDGQDSYAYTGEPVVFNPVCEVIDTWTYTYYENETQLDAAPSAPGSYRVEISGEGANHIAKLSHSYSIVAPEVPPKETIQYSISVYSGYYDGAAHSITVRVATEGARVTYSESENGAYSAENPSYTEPGEYTVYFKIEKDGYETVVDSASVTIWELDEIEYTVSDYSGYYDGAAHTFDLAIAEGVSATYATSASGPYSATKPSFTEPGFYTVWFRLEKEGYETVVDSASVTITELGQIEYSVKGYHDYYDGAAHTIDLSVVTGGVTATFATSEDGPYSADMPSFTDPGKYTVWFRLEREGYETVTGFATVTIIGKIEYSVEDYVGYYDGQWHSFTLNVITEGVIVAYAEKEDGTYNPSYLPRFTDIGTYTVWFRLEKVNHETVIGSATVTIAKPGTILYTVESYIGAYDGQPHTISLNVLTEGVTVTYFVSGAGSKTPPTFTEPGTYTVWYRLEKSDYETVTGSATVTIEKAEQILYFKQTVRPVDPSENSTTTFLYWSGLIHDRGDGALSWSCSDPDRISVSHGDIRTGTLRFDVPYEEWCKGYTATITATAAETDHYKAATATCTVMASSSIQGSYSVKWFYNQSGAAADVGSNLDVDKKSQNQEKLLSTNLNLTVRPVTEQDGNLLSSVSDALRRKLMASAGSDQIGAMAVDAALTDNQTGEELHSTTGDLTLSPTGSLAQSYKKNYKNMACVAVHIKQDSTNAVPTDEGYDFTMPTGDVTVNSSFAPMPDSTPAPQDTIAPDTTAAPANVVSSFTTFGSLKIGEGLYVTGNSSEGGVPDFIVSANEIQKQLLGTDNSNEGQLLASTLGDLTLVPVGSLSPTVEFLPCKLTESGVVIRNTSLSPFLLIYGPKEAFSKLLTVRAKDGVFTYDGEGHAVAAEPSIEEGTSLYYSLDLESWQTEAPAFTDVLWNEDGSVGSYQVYVLADNPDCDPAVCSYTVTILPAE